MVSADSDAYCNACWTEWASIMGQDIDSYRNRARELGRRTKGNITFEGAFTQAVKNNPANLLAIPFVITQSPEEIERMKRHGDLDGVIVEADCMSPDRGGIALILKGELSTGRVVFDKQYIDEPRSKVIIHYEGSLQQNGTYKGRWKFSEEQGIVATEGDFFLLRIS